MTSANGNSEGNAQWATGQLLDYYDASLTGYGIDTMAALSGGRTKGPGKLFKEFIVLFAAVYGEITHSDALKRQHVTGTPDLRLPGVFWCNYYSNEYLELMNCREQMESFDWWKKEDMEEGTMTFLSEDPKDLVEPNYLEENARQYFGEEVFFAKERS